MACRGGVVAINFNSIPRTIQRPGERRLRHEFRQACLYLEVETGRAMMLPGALSAPLPTVTSIAALEAMAVARAQPGIVVDGEYYISKYGEPIVFSGLNDWED